VQKAIPHLSLAVYGAYTECYSDPNVDVIHIGTRHAFYKRNCLDAIAAGKHVREGVYTEYKGGKGEGCFCWTRFFPLTRSSRRLLHEEKILGDIGRIFADFALDMNFKSMEPKSRYKKRELGAGSLLDIIQSHVGVLLCLDEGIGGKAEGPKIVSAQALEDGIEMTSSIVLSYPSTGRQGILTFTFGAKTDLKFARIEGTKGTIFIEGSTPRPQKFTFVPNGEDVKEQVFEFDAPGFFFEADAVALDVAAGRMENSIMPWTETIRVMEIMNEIRYCNGALFPHDTE
jgi:predicted dehydrogenase